MRSVSYLRAAWILVLLTLLLSAAAEHSWALDPIEMSWFTATDPFICQTGCFLLEQPPYPACNRPCVVRLCSSYSYSPGVHVQPRYNGEYTYNWSGSVTGAVDGDAQFAATAPGSYVVTCLVSAEGMASTTATFNITIDQGGPPECEDSLCDDNGGGGCSSCGSGGDCPSPSLGTFDVPIRLTGNVGPGVIGGGTDPTKGCKAGKYEVYTFCDGVYIKVWDCAGKCSLIGPYLGGDYDFCAGAKWYTAHVESVPALGWCNRRVVTVTEWGGNTTVVEPSDYTAGNLGHPTTISDPDGNVTTYSHAANGAIEKVTLPTNEAWLYGHDINDTKITWIKAPDGAYTKVNYVSSGDAAGKLESVRLYASEAAYNASEDPLSSSEYDYNEDGTLGEANCNGKVVTYTYDENDHKITVTQDNGDDLDIVTEYHYGQTGESNPGPNETWVTQKHNSNSNLDQTTKYAYCTDVGGNKLPYLSSVTDPLGNRTAYTYSTSYPGLVEDVCHYDGQDVLLRKTHTAYNANRTVSSVSNYDGSDNLIGQEFSYYYTGTTWLERKKDIRGNWTYYVRNANNLSQLQAVKVAEGPNEPANWANVPNIKEYEYYEPTDITNTATLTWDSGHELDSPDLTPDNLNDGEVGESKEDAAGDWVYSELGSEYDANASYWTWNSTQALARIDLYLKQEATDYRPEALKILAKDAAGNYTINLYSNYGVTWLTTETYDSESVYSLHVPAGICTTGIKIVYGSRDPSDPPHLGEVVIWGTTGGMIGQLKTEIVPHGDQVNEQVTGYKYSRNGKVYPSVTETTYLDSDDTEQASETFYDDFDRVSKTTDANGCSIWYRYDSRGRLTLTVYKWLNDVVDGTPDVYTESHYSCCNLEWSRDEEGNKTYYAYDDLKRITDVWTDIQNPTHAYPPPQGTAPLVHYDYDCFGNESTVTTYSGLLDESENLITRETTYSYDKLNRVTSIEYPDQIVGGEEFGYDTSGNLWWKQDGNGDVTLYRYDSHNRLWKTYYNYTGSPPPSSYPANAQVTYSYEGNSNLKTSMEERNAGGTLLRTSSYTYDFMGRLDQYTPPVGLSSGYYVDYDYNNLGEKTRIRIWNGTTTNYDINYDYFANGWLNNVKNGATPVAAYTYDTVGNRTDTDYGYGTHIDYAFDSDPRYRTTSITHKYGANVLAEIGYPSTGDHKRDNVGNPGSMTDWTGTWNYNYDSNNRLIRAIAPNPIPGQPGGTSGNYGGVPYDYDWVGNRIHPPGEPNPMVYNNADQLVRWPGMHGTAEYPGYVYDDAGNLTTVKDATAIDESLTTVASYTYTPADLLDEADFAYTSATDSKAIKNTWDADSNRVRLGVGTRSSQQGYVESYHHDFVYDATAGIPAVIEETTPTSTIYYIREPGGELIARLNSTDGVRYYHFDELGSTRLLTDASGTVTDKYAYDAYGSLLSHEAYTGSVDQPYQYVGQLGYYTHYMEPDFGLLQLGVRFYDAEVGRFTQRDPIPADELSQYTYSMDVPSRMVDPTGLAPVDPCKPDPQCFSCEQCTYKYDKKGKKICKLNGECWKTWLLMASNCDVKYCNPVTNRGRDFVKCMDEALKKLKKLFK